MREDFDLELEGNKRNFLESETIEYYMVDWVKFPAEKYTCVFRVYLRELTAVSALYIHTDKIDMSIKRR